MKLIYKNEFPFPGIYSVEIFAQVKVGSNSYYPINIEGKSFELRMVKEGVWSAINLSSEICLFVGDIIERYNL